MSPINPKVSTIVNFNGSSATAATGTTITSYAWDFGDGPSGGPPSTGAGVTTTHIYGFVFTWTIRLTVIDSLGRTATVTNSLTVAP